MDPILAAIDLFPEECQCGHPFCLANTVNNGRGSLVMRLRHHRRYSQKLLRRVKAQKTLYGEEMSPEFCAEFTKRLNETLLARRPRREGEQIAYVKNLEETRRRMNDAPQANMAGMLEAMQFMAGMAALGFGL